MTPSPRRSPAATLPAKGAAPVPAPGARRSVSSFAPLKVQRTFEIVVEQIRDRIFSGEYKHGDRLPPEREFAEILGIGRPAVREAYRALEMIGVVEIRKGKQGGAFVTEQDHRLVTQTLGDLIRLQRISILDLTEARLVLERDVVQLAMHRATVERMARLRACVDTAITQSRAGITATEENLRFHVLLGEMSGNPVLAMLLTSLIELLRLVIRAVSPKPHVSLKVAEDHLRIIEALEAGDFELLWEVLETNIRRTDKLRSLPQFMEPGTGAGARDRSRPGKGAPARQPAPGNRGKQNP